MCFAWIFYEPIRNLYGEKNFLYHITTSQGKVSQLIHENSIPSGLFKDFVFSALCLGILFCSPIYPQVQELTSGTEGIRESGEQEKPPIKFVFPDVPDDWIESVTFRFKHWSLGIGLATLLDYSILSQDETNIAQVGKQANKLEFRSFRLLFRGTLDFLGPLSYLLAAEYNGFGREPEEKRFNITDLSLTWKLQKSAGRFTFGKQKEPFIYEMVGDAANLPHHERLLEPFFSARNTGIRWDTDFFKRRMGFSLGWYNDWWHKPGGFSDNGNQLSARLIGRPVWLNEGAQLLHLGISARYVEGDGGVLRYRGRPGSHVTVPYVDTGKFDADHAWHMGMEALWSGHHLSILGEYARAWVVAPDLSDPTFSGYYVTVSYVINGNLRPYDPAVGYARRPQLNHRWGTIEPIFRYGRVDLDDAKVQGGKMRKWYVGLNWWATKRWKISVGYGNIALDRFGMIGKTNQVLIRFQWIKP